MVAIYGDKAAEREKAPALICETAILADVDVQFDVRPCGFRAATNCILSASLLPLPLPLPKHLIPVTFAWVRALDRSTQVPRYWYICYYLILARTCPSNGRDGSTLTQPRSPAAIDKLHILCCLNPYCDPAVND